ncbi:MAG: hypothetical protein J6N22_00080, partial [Schwartzia sp.]|nr:hypothetical protein [Schwartzia sp. (in: firmicutes)]
LSQTANLRLPRRVAVPPQSTAPRNDCFHSNPPVEIAVLVIVSLYYSMKKSAFLSRGGKKWKMTRFFRKQQIRQAAPLPFSCESGGRMIE